MSPISSRTIAAARAAAGYGPEVPRSHTKAAKSPSRTRRRKAGQLDTPYPTTRADHPAPILHAHLDRVEDWLYTHPGPQPVRLIAEQLGIPRCTLQENRHTRTLALWRGIIIRLGKSRGWRYDPIPQTWELPWDVTRHGPPHHTRDTRKNTGVQRVD